MNRKCMPIFLGLLVSVPTVAGARERQQLAVLPTQFDETSRGMVPKLFDDYLLTAVQNVGEFDVIGQDDISALLGFEQQKDLLGCDDAACIADIGGALGVDRILVVKIARIGEDWVITSKLLDIRAAKVDARSSDFVPGSVKDLLKAVPSFVAKLFNKQVPPPSQARPTPSGGGAGSPCGMDADCPGTMVCNQGRCATSGAATPGAPVQSHQAASVTPGWALGGGIAGLACAVGTMAMMTGAAMTSDNGERMPSLGLNTVGVALTIVCNPVAAAGSGSARRTSFVKGVRGLRITSWISYGIHIGGGLILLAYGLANRDPGFTLTTGVGFLGAFATAAMGVDGIVSAVQAKRVASQMKRPQTASTWQLIPVASLVRLGADKLQPVYGLGVVF